MIVSWVTADEPGSSVVRYWSENNHEKKLAKGKVLTYRYFNYSSGFIHHCTIRNLEVRIDCCHGFSVSEAKLELLMN